MDLLAFKPGTRGPMYAWPPEIALACMSASPRVCACVPACTSAPEAINNKPRERHNWIMKPYSHSVSLYDTAINKLGIALATPWVVNACQRSTNKSESFNYKLKVSGRMHSNAFKRRLGLSFNVT